jgi:hypothetical protein
MQHKKAVTAFFTKFSASLCKWVVVCRAYGVVRAEFLTQGEAEEYADLRIRHEFELRGRVKTLPPPPMTMEVPQ